MDLVGFAVSFLLLSFAWTADASVSCGGLVTDKLKHSLSDPTAPRPHVGSYFSDTAFGSRLVRIDDALSAGSPSSGDKAIVPMYSTVSAWNADETRLILYRVGVGHRLYNGMPPYSFIKALPINPVDLEQVFWDPINPKIFFYIDSGGTLLKKYDVTTDVQVTSFNLGAGGCSGFTAGTDPFAPSFDDNMTMGLWAVCAGTPFATYFALRKNYVAGFFSRPGATDNLAPSVSADSKTSVLFSTVLSVANPPVNQRTLSFTSAEHASLGNKANGETHLFRVAFGAEGTCAAGALNSFNLGTGSCTEYMPQSAGWPYPPSSTHVSAMAYKAPGWVFTSHVGSPSTSWGQNVLDNEVVLTNTNTGQVCRVCHHRSWARDSPLATGYWGEPHVVASPSGTRALFGSTWGNAAQVDPYVVELPSFSSATTTTGSSTTSPSFSAFIHPTICVLVVLVAILLEW